MNMIPPRIYHVEKPGKAYAMDTAHLAAKSIHLTPSAEKLLLFYANSKSGFRPSLDMISKSTGIHKNNVIRYRLELEKMGCLRFDRNKNEILVDWKRISIYATLDPSMTKTKRKSSVYVAPAFAFDRVDDTIGSLGKKYKMKKSRKLTKAEKNFYTVLDKMTENEWNSLQAGLGVMIPEPIDLYSGSLYDYEDEELNMIGVKDISKVVPLPDNYKSMVVTYDLPF